MLNGMIEVSDLGCPRQFAVEVAPVIACAIGNSHDLQLWARGYNGRKFVTEHPLDGCLLRFRHSSHADRVQRCALVIVDRHGGAGRLAIAGGNGDHDAVQRHRHYDGLLRDFLGETKALLNSARCRDRQAVERATTASPTKTTEQLGLSMRGHPCERPANDPGPPLVLGPRRCGRRRDSARRGRGPEVRYSHSLRRTKRCTTPSTRTAGACTSKRASSSVVAARSTAEHSARTSPNSATSADSESTFLDRPASPAYLWSSAPACASIPASLLLVGALRDSIGLCPVSPWIAPAATRPSRRVPCREPIPRMVAAPFVPRPLATHAARDRVSYGGPRA